MTYSRYQRLKEDLEATGTGTMKTGGGSMTPIFPAKTVVLMTYRKQDSYEVGDIVFCYCRGRWIDAHFIIAKDLNKGFLIANNHGHQNGWTHKIFGKVVQADWGSTVKTF